MGDQRVVEADVVVRTGRVAWKEGGVEGLDFAVGRANALLLDFHLFAREG